MARVSVVAVAAGVRTAEQTEVARRARGLTLT
jgi:hypothetical protein